MNDKIRKHLEEYCAENKWGVDDDTLIEILENSEIYSEKVDDRRWWTDCFCVADVNGMLIGFSGAETTGDDSPRDKGWEFDMSSVCEVEKKTETKTVITYVEKK